MGKPTPKQTWVGLAFAALTAATGYLGIDKYQASQISVGATEVNVAITSMPAGTIRSNADINAMIKTLVNAKMKEHVHDSGRH